METLHVGLLGFGTVGSGVVRVLRENADEIEARLGSKLVVRKIAVRDAKKPRLAEIDDSILTLDVEEVLADPKIDIIVELIGGTTEAADYIFRAIERKKHVVTANKALIATRGSEVFAAANKNGVDVFFEGAVGGGIPIIRALRESLTSDRILSIMGIVNGTTNFILTEMNQKSRSFSEALKDAQDRGFAEADPSADVDGHDAAQKLSILASLGFGTKLSVSDVYVEGLREVTSEDMKMAASFDHAIKLLAIAERVGQKVALRVHPCWVSESSMLAHVAGAYNAVLLKSEALGTSLFYGQGAGQMPTGSAVVSDVMDVARNIRIGRAGRVPHLATRAEAMRPAEVLDIGQTRSAFVLKFQVRDQPGVLGRIASCLGEHSVSLRTVHQEISALDMGRAVPIVVITHPAKEQDVRTAVQSIERFGVTQDGTRVMRIVDAS